jgi:N-acetylmuramoyl-L-alanine amidase
LKQIRIAETQQDTRVVFDLEGPMEVSASQLANPARLIVELRPMPTGSPAPTAAPEPVSPSPLTVASKSESVREPLAPLPVAVVHTAPPEPQRELAKAAPVTAKSTPVARTTKSEPDLPVGLPAKRDSTGNRSLVRVLGLKIGRVIIDPGHGGHDTGTIGTSGIMEKDIALDVSKRLAALIEEQLGSEVILTRTDDTFVPLELRTALANEKRADLFLSIHVNSSRLRTAAGVETFYLNFSTSPADLEVAARENASSQKTVHELTELLQKIALKDKIEESREFASAVQAAVFPVSATTNARAKNRGVKKAPFVVLIGASMPSVLAEIGFVSNPREESLLRKPEHRQKLAEALYKGVAAYAGTLSHFQVAKSEN